MLAGEPAASIVDWTPGGTPGRADAASGKALPEGGPNRAARRAGENGWTLGATLLTVILPGTAAGACVTGGAEGSGRFDPAHGPRGGCIGAGGESARLRGTAGRPDGETGPYGAVGGPLRDGCGWWSAGGGARSTDDIAPK